MIKPVHFYFIRHGETDWNKERRPMGKMDIPLNETGINQALTARHLLENLGIKTICHSPLLRAQKTAEIINEILKVPMIEIANLTECGWGSIEGNIRQPHETQDWRVRWMQGIPGDGTEEPYVDFKKRVIEGMNASLELPGPVLIVAHGGIYWAVQDVLSLEAANTPNCVPIVHKPSEHAPHRFEIYSLPIPEKGQSYGTQTL